MEPGTVQTANLAFTNTVRGSHSEAHADDFLNELGIDPGSVRAIYSERNFCTTPRHDCAGRMSRFTNASLSWSFEKGQNAWATIMRVAYGG
ncbi:nucleic acid/nucleotide deaminase domain-containing protein [Streptomyces fructofermentans]|uniref:nucleic acid/nucleotide deaminase domain-containing protein n=1 Tax=Streptomyces fructofermentans TaxID=152141 RepID=UPI0035716AFB